VVNIEVDLKGMRHGGMDRIHLAQDLVYGKLFVNMVMAI
jgi:hypothetical protein